MFFYTKIVRYKKILNGNNKCEIKDQNGNVLNEHYETKEACVCAGKKLATECGCGLTVCDHTETK